MMPLTLESFLHKRRRQRKSRRHLTHEDFAMMMRVNPAKHERILWAALRNRQCGGILFEHQVPMLGWIVDFLAPEIYLIVEVDGREHRYGRKKRGDVVRDRVLASQGFTVLRFSNDEVLYQLPQVVATIRKNAERFHNLAAAQAEVANEPRATETNIRPIQQEMVQGQTTAAGCF